jgi:hypothetical protein
MDYTTLIGEAWATTWRYRFLWVLGLLAGATGGTMGLGRFSLPDWSSAAEWTAPVALLAQSWIDTNVLLVGGLALGLGSGAIALSVIARGGITQATIDLQSGAPSSFGRAWRAGTHWFWRFLGLLVLLGVLAAIVVGALVLMISNLGGAGALLGALVLTLGVVASIVLAYAERAIVVHDLSLGDALGHGWRVFSDHLSTSLLTWMLSVMLAAVIGALVASMWTLVAGVTAVIALVTLAAIANTFFWSFWTLAYLRLDPPVTA